ncbi:hypothetical protein SGRIM128S_05749 [Streptomyces griseomycini]
MPGGQRVQHGQSDPGALGRGQRAAPGDQLTQVDGARDVLHDDPGQPFVLQHVVHGHHVRVAAQARRVPGLRAGPRHPGLALLTGLGRIVEHDLLEGDLARESLVVGEPDVSHAAAAQPAQQQVAAGDDPADSGRR